MNSIFLAINLALIYFAWTFVLKRSIIDYYKDSILFLKDDIDSFYEKNGISFDDDTYKALNELIDSYLTMMGNMSMVRIMVFSNGLKNDARTNAYAFKKVEKKFKTNNTKLKEFSQIIRSRANNIAIACLILSTPAMLLVGFVLVLRSIPSFIVDSLMRKEFKHAYKEMTGSIRKFFWKKVATQDRFEDFILLAR